MYVFSSLLVIIQTLAIIYINGKQINIKHTVEPCYLKLR